MPMARAVAGFTLVEVMIAVLVLALGIVGGVSMQLAALRARHQSTLLAQASWLAVGMAERMRANPEQMRLPDGGNLYLTLDYDVLAEPNPSMPSALCYGGDCDGAQLAAFDLYEMKALMRENLPAGRAVVCRDAGLWSGGKLRWACSGGAGAPLVIKVGWRGKNPNGTQRKDEAGEYVPGVALTVGAP
ncbi:type IV pilus modification protein PilV [Oxalobacteraceae bacterium OTU3CAMAD1]|nr:type IV pilus modification protein PilV [Oxalobacteraceae bacterium OTU3CAMAD1]